MRTIMNFRILVMLSFFLLAPVLTQAQTDKKAAELKKLETGLATAKAKVAANEKKMAIADSLITSGTQLLAESKTEDKAIGSERKILDKEYVANQKPLAKQSSSKDKEEAIAAKAELKTLTAQYKLDTKALDTRLKDATKKYNTGNANLTKGKTAKKTAKDALKMSQESLDIAQAKYDAATAPPEDSASKNKKKK